jgi:tetratricopeptide (TPR) repeat protein
MVISKIIKKILGSTVLVTLFLPAFTYAASQSKVYYQSGNAYVYTEQGQYGLAIVDGTKTVELKPQADDRTSSLINFGKDYAREAIAECTKAIELNPQDVDSYNRRAAAYRSLDKPYLAIEDYNRVLKIDASNREAFHGKYEILMGSQIYHYSESYVNDTSYNPFPR